MSFLRRLSAWWNKDELERAEEDYEARKDDVVARDGLLGGGATDYEADSERPRRQDSS